MMMLTQCVTFGSVSEAFWEHWKEPLPLQNTSVGKAPASVSNCDWRETQDMVDFQAFVGKVKVKDGLPDVRATGVPLSVIFVAHHNLVTYGVPFLNDMGKWTNPGPKKTFYEPKNAIEQLAPLLDQWGGNTEVSDWLKNNQDKLDVKNVPGMAAWVQMAKEKKWDVPRSMDKKVEWLEFHELDDRM